jgi:RHS repeat-associated protein
MGPTTLGDLTYAYDSAGRRVSVGGTFARTGLPLAVASAAHNANNELTTWGSGSLTYDAGGNLISDGVNTYMWDARNQLASISGASPASFQYDAFGRRAKKTVSGVTTEFLYDGVNPVQELSGGTPTANLLAGLAIDEYFTRTDAAGTRTLLADGLGSTLALLDSAGAVQTEYTYEPFGKVAVAGATSGNAFQYTGRENDGTGLYHYRARYYNPQVGRFISGDPLEFRGGDANLYAYVWNSPLNFLDPFGWWGFGVSAGVAVEYGAVGVGAGATGSVGGGGFFDGMRPSIGGFASGGAFAGGPGWGASAPPCPSKNNWALGGFAGGGANVFLTNANNVLDLSGPFRTYSFNSGWGLRILSIQFSIGQNAAGQMIWNLSYGGPLGLPFPTGGGYGLDVSAYNTNTRTTSGGGKCPCK